MIESIQFGVRSDALYVIRQAAKHLIERHEPLWQLDELTIEQVFHACQDENIVTGYMGGDPVAAMLLTYHDPNFWPDVPPDKAGFIHKLSVVPDYQGQGIAAQMINFAKHEVKSKGILWLRLDCHLELSKLRNFYERLGFRCVREGIAEAHPTAFYEIGLCGYLQPDR
ncbi:MAG: GNAT family N-acetyltransferase [Cyanobacteria bacterium P01_H01_bin.105]